MAQKEADFAIAVDDHRQGRVDKAERAYRHLLEGNPQHADARHMLGVALLQKGNAAGAEEEIRRALSIRPDDVKFRNNLGNALSAQNRIDEAATEFDAAASADPEFSDAAFNLGTSMIALGNLSKAAQIFTDLVRQSPDDPDPLINLVAALTKGFKADEARDWCRRGLERWPDDFRLLSSLASILEQLNDVEEAADVIARCMKNDPAGSWPRIVNARILRRRECFEDALVEIEAALEHSPPSDIRGEALHEKGLILDRLKRAGEAFQSIASANRIFAQTVAAKQCDATLLPSRCQTNRDWFDERRLGSAKKAMAAETSADPVFFVGFPRSGTTLMESVLEAHPEIATTAEQSPLWAAEREAMNNSGQAFPHCLGELNEGDWETLRARFWKRADEVTNGVEARLLVDKTPLNIVDLGFANMLFPQAKILIALRDPRDVCLSCFFQRFRLNDQMVGFLDLETTARTYAAVMGLWLHYRMVLSSPWMEYAYEDLTYDFEGTVSRVLNFIEKEWHPDMSGYRDKARERQIRTPSYRDVTAPVTRRAVGRWKAYASELTPALDILKPFAETFGYPSRK
ncbi:MAG: tetratricopeptide repeat protein [Rhodospirillales bacterium]|nr:tetratricopeptide repeat protein [Rhodospirillales bacterium]